MLVGDLAGRDRRDVAVGGLHEPLAAGREVVAHLGAVRGQPFEVDDVHVGAVAGREHAAVEQADRARGRAGVALHEERQRQPTVIAVAAPEREQRRREARVADRADVRAAVGEPDDGVRMGQHLADRVEVAVAVVEERDVEQRAAVVRAAAGRRRGRAARGLRARPALRDARRRIGFVVGRVAELEHAVEACRMPRELPLFVVEEPGAERGIADRDGLFVQRAVRDLAVDRVGEQRVQRALQAEEEADRRGARPARSS